MLTVDQMIEQAKSFKEASQRAVKDLTEAEESASLGRKDSLSDGDRDMLMSTIQRLAAAAATYITGAEICNRLEVVARSITRLEDTFKSVMSADETGKAERKEGTIIERRDGNSDTLYDEDGTKVAESL